MFKWSPSRSARTRSLPEQIAERVGNQIVTGELQPGQRIQEQGLAEQFDVSRGPIREALRILEKDGLVQIEPRRGVQVTQLTVEEVSDIFEIRAALLGVAAKLATERRDDEITRHISQSAERLKEIAPEVEADEYVANVHLLNLSMAEACGNSRLADMIFSLAHQTLRYARLGLSTQERRRQSAQNWQRLANAMKRGEADAAKAAAERLVHDSRATAVHLLKQQEAAEAAAGVPSRARRR